jgi:hypothetical protein
MFMCVNQYTRWSNPEPAVVLLKHVSCNRHRVQESMSCRQDGAPLIHRRKPNFQKDGKPFGFMKESIVS